MSLKHSQSQRAASGSVEQHDAALGSSTQRASASTQSNNQQAHDDGTTTHAGHKKKVRRCFGCPFVTHTGGCRTVCRLISGFVCAFVCPHSERKTT